jgi:hypothetical protein
MMTTGDESPALTLPKTNLTLAGDSLVLRTKRNETISSIALASITDIFVRKETDWFGIVFSAAIFAGGLACKSFIASSVLGWWLGGGLCAFAVICLLGLKRVLLVVQTKEGEVRFEVKDMPLDAEAFSLSVKQRARG